MFVRVEMTRLDSGRTDLFDLRRTFALDFARSYLAQAHFDPESHKRVGSLPFSSQAREFPPMEAQICLPPTQMAPTPIWVRPRQSARLFERRRGRHQSCACKNASRCARMIPDLLPVSSRNHPHSNQLFIANCSVEAGIDNITREGVERLRASCWCHHVINDARQFVCGGRDCFGAPHGRIRRK